APCFDFDDGWKSDAFICALVVYFEELKVPRDLFIQAAVYLDNFHLIAEHADILLSKYPTEPLGAKAAFVDMKEVSHSVDDLRAWAVARSPCLSDKLESLV